MLRLPLLLPGLSGRPRYPAFDERFQRKQDHRRDLENCRTVRFQRAGSLPGLRRLPETLPAEDRYTGYHEEIGIPVGRKRVAIIRTGAFMKWRLHNG